MGVMAERSVGVFIGRIGELWESWLGERRIVRVMWEKGELGEKGEVFDSRLGELRILGLTAGKK